MIFYCLKTNLLYCVVIQSLVNVVNTCHYTQWAKFSYQLEFLSTYNKSKATEIKGFHLTSPRPNFGLYISLPSGL